MGCLPQGPHVVLGAPTMCSCPAVSNTIASPPLPRRQHMVCPSMQPPYERSPQPTTAMLATSPSFSSSPHIHFPCSHYFVGIPFHHCRVRSPLALAWSQQAHQASDPTELLQGPPTATTTAAGATGTVVAM